MIVPQFWAEASARHRADGRQVTVRRFGWSDESADDAQAMAERRAREALARVVSGVALSRREPRIPYNGAHGVPIREEIVDRCGAAVVTRNSYGARCLNSPDVLFADVDFDAPLEFRFVATTFAALATCAIGLGVLAGSKLLGAVLFLAAMATTSTVVRAARRLRDALQGGPVERTRRGVRAFLATHPGWNVRLYRTPSGMRLIATHAPVDPTGDDARAFFASVDADVTYRRLCVQQRCYRARLSAKPWRIGIASHMRPRPGFWPVRAERRAERSAWIDAYEARARGYAACTYLESVGSNGIDPRLVPTIEYHDRACRALEPGLPIA
jgi:hypothetical protein